MSPQRRMVMLTLVVAISICAASSLITGAVAATIGISAYSQATGGIAHLKNGENLLKNIAGSGFSTESVKQARGEFAAAQQDFQSVNTSIGLIPSGLDGAPGMGGKLAAMRNLASLAGNFSQIGVAACDAAIIALDAVSNPFGKSGSSHTTNSSGDTTVPADAGLTADGLATIQVKVNSIQALLDASTTQLNALQPGDLSFDPKIGAQLQKLKAELPTIQGYLKEAESILGVAAPLLGIGTPTPTSYLVELLDSTELRPGGGFIGNIGFLTVQNAVLAGLHVQDVDLLDSPYRFSHLNDGIPFPSQYTWFPASGVFGTTPVGWSLRDSNLDADFPTDAQNAELTYNIEGGKVQTQGVIAITPWLIEKAIAITGNIYVPEVNETVTTTNLVNLIHIHQLGKGHGSDYISDPKSASSERKKFTAYLFVHFMDKVKSLLKTERTKFVKLAFSALATKDVQVYFNNPIAENILQKHHLASTLDAPTTGDSLFVVDANVIANKANNFITYSMVDDVTVDSKGNATHYLTLTYNWPQSAAYDANAYGTKYFYNDYVRIYVPPKATLISQSGWNYNGQQLEFGRAVFAGFLSFWYGSTATISVSWVVPGAAVKSGNAWTYQELIQHQAGNIWTVSMGIALPAACGQVSSVTAPWKAVTGKMPGATFKGPLTEDGTYQTVYTCTAK